MDTERHAGRAVLVTGAGHGIGRACAQRLAAEGARVVVTDLDEAAVAEVARELGDAHRSLGMDVTDTASVDRAVAAAAAHLGGLDLLVNVAGGDVPHGAFEEIGDDVWSAMLELNLMSVVRCCRAALPYLRASRRGPVIVSTTSVNALAALSSEPYSAAKLGIVALTRNLAAELGPDGIRVNAVAPGTIRTRVWDGQPGGADRLTALYPLGRVGEPEDIAAAVAYLGSSDAGWVTGHTLPVDGGLMTGYRAPTTA